MKPIFKYLVGGLLVLGSWYVQGQSNEDKCGAELEKLQEVKSGIESYKKDCGKFPRALHALVVNTNKCKDWGNSAHGPYIPKSKANELLLSSYFYSVAKKSFAIKPKHCPN